MRILLIRNDKLGDFMLSLPCFVLLKNSIKNCQTDALVPDYTSDIAKTCTWIDNVILDPGPESSLGDQWDLLLTLRKNKYDAVICLYSTVRIGIISLFINAKYRLAPATKLAQIFYFHRLKQRRSASLKPEFLYNIDLVNHFLEQHSIIPRPTTPPYLQFRQDEVEPIKKDFIRSHSVRSNNRIIFVHTCSGGSATNLSLEQYALLIKKLASDNLYFVLTAGPGELGAAQTVSAELSDIPHTVFHSTQGLVSFAKHIAFADLFISGSTGPLHIAGALNVPTAAFYPLRQSATPLRWQTLNSEDRRIAFSPPETGDKEDMSRIDLDVVAGEIRKKYFS